MNDGKKIRVAFSGGGFRATFYCLGAFRRLVELGLADKVISISSVSGGSITAGAIMEGLLQGQFDGIDDFDKKVTEPLRKLGQVRLREIITWPVYISCLVFTFFYIQRIAPFVNSILLFLCPFNISSWLLLVDIIIYFLIFYFFLKPTMLFSKLFLFFLFLFFKGKRMQSLPKFPEWSANATCLNTGKRFRFKRNSLGGHNVGVTGDNKDVRVSFAVACSAAFPPVFAPIKLSLKGRNLSYRPYDKPAKNQKTVLLTDGGVYDNLGSEPLLSANNFPKNQSDGKNKQEECFIVLDAGDYISSWSSGGHWFGNTGRIIASALDQIICLRRRLIYRETISGMPGILLILGRSVEEYINNGAVTKRDLEKEFFNGSEIFDWLMENGYFEGTPGVKGYLKSFTDASLYSLRKKYPDQYGQILAILQQIHNIFGQLSEKVISMHEYKKFLDKDKMKTIDDYLPDIRTDLDGFHDMEIDSLMWAGRVRMDIAIKRYLGEHIPSNLVNDVPKMPPYSTERIRQILLKGRRESIWVMLRGFLHLRLHEKIKGMGVKEKIRMILSRFQRKR